MKYTYPESYSTDHVTPRKPVKSPDGVFRYETHGDLAQKRIAQGLETIAREDKLGKRAFRSRMLALTLQAARDTASERQYYMQKTVYDRIIITEEDSVTWIEDRPTQIVERTYGDTETVEEPLQTQKTRLRDYWTRQLAPPISPP